jgi:hypothetical protein
MKNALTILLVLILAAETVVWLQMRRLFKGWEKDVENDDKQLTDEEVHYVEVRMKLLSFLTPTAGILLLLRFIVFELIPLIRG